jgi:hypothetical protein
VRVRARVREHAVISCTVTVITRALLRVAGHAFCVKKTKKKKQEKTRARFIIDGRVSAENHNENRKRVFADWRDRAVPGVSAN